MKDDFEPLIIPGVEKHHMIGIEYGLTNHDEDFESLVTNGTEGVFIKTGTFNSMKYDATVDKEPIVEYNSAQVAIKWQKMLDVL